MLAIPVNDTMRQEILLRLLDLSICDNIGMAIRLLLASYLARPLNVCYVHYEFLLLIKAITSLK